MTQQEKKYSITIALSFEMHDAINDEMQKLKLFTHAETVRYIISQYFSEEGLIDSANDVLKTCSAILRELKKE